VEECVRRKGVVVDDDWCIPSIETFLPSVHDCVNFMIGRRCRGGRSVPIVSSTSAGRGADEAKERAALIEANLCDRGRLRRSCWRIMSTCGWVDVGADRESWTRQARRRD
jgi:hypothetical protein